jgi:hypothetical protein
MRLNAFACGAAVLAGLSLAACSGSSVHSEAGDPADLQRRFHDLHAAILSDNRAEAARITQALLPDRQRLAKALSDAVLPEHIDRILNMHSEFLSDANDVAALLAPGPDQTSVGVFHATVEDLVEYAPGTTAFESFATGARDLARMGILRPGLTFYQVKVRKPGSEYGTTYHLFYWDGEDWAMVGPAWRVIKPAAIP